MACPRLESYLRLISQKAWQTWYKLPPQHKSWIDVEDLIQDGVLFARFTVFPQYRPHKAKFTTFLTTSLENFYKNLLAECFTKKRNDCRVVPVCSVQYRLTAWDNLEQEVKAVKGLLKVVAEASPVLRRYLNHWLFLQGKMHCKGRHFAVARTELLRLGRECGFGRDDFEYLLRNETWRRGVQATQQKFLIGHSKPVKFQ